MKRKWTILVGVLLPMLAACSDKSEPNESSEKMAEKEAPVEEYVSKTPGAKIYMQPPSDPNIVWRGIDNKIALIDEKSGDMVLSQVADRERRIMHLAYVTKDRELVRTFMTQWGGGTYARRWKVFPIRVWNIEEARKLTPDAEAALPRATLEHFAQFMASWPNFGDTPFMLIDAPVSEEDPL